MLNRTWIQTIKLGKATIVAELTHHAIEHNVQENYFRLCSKLWKYYKARKLQLCEAEAWLDKATSIVEMIGGLIAKTENRYWKSIIIYDNNHRRIGRVWSHIGNDDVYYETNRMAKSGQAIAPSVQEAIKEIASQV